MQDELHVTADDLAVTAAKEKLAMLADRPGYRQAMTPRPTGSRRAAWILSITGVAFVGLAMSSCTYVSAGWFRSATSAVFILLGVFSWFLAIGASRDPAPDAWPAVVLQKIPDADPASPSHQLSLLRDNGATVTVRTNDALHAIVRAGDVGVAHIRHATHAPAPTMVAFHRL